MTPTKREIAFIDRNVDDLTALLAGLRPQVEPILLSDDEPAVRQMAAAVQYRTDLTAIHVIAHGRPGEVSFGSQALAFETLEKDWKDLAAIGNALGSDGDLLLWSCRTGEGERGAAFIERVARATGAQVIAATNLVGAAGLGGSWALDSARDVRPPLTVEGMATYPEVLSVKKASLTGITTDTGTVGDFITDDNTLVFSGTDKDSGSSTLGIWISGGVYGSLNGGKGTLIGTLVLSPGQTGWSFDFTGTRLADGTYTISLTDGTSSSASPLSSQAITIDTVAPTVSSIATSGPGITNGSGDLNANHVVTLTVNFSEKVTVNTAGGIPALVLNDGGIATYTGGSGTSALTFSYTVAAGQNTSDLTVSSFSLNGATVQDIAGNTANLTGANNFNPAGTLIIDTAAPAMPTGVTLDSTTDSGTVGDGITNFSQVKIDGTAEPGSTVTLYDTNGSTVLGTGVASATTGAFSITTSVLSNGTHNITTTATDAAGNVSAASAGYAVTIDTAAPGAPTGLALDPTTDSGALGDGVTNFSQAKIDGTAEPGSTVTLYDTNGSTVLGTGIANATTGAFSIATSGLSSGAHGITAKATDAAGNIGAASAAYTVTVDTTAPAVPTGLTLDPTTDSGALGDGITSFAQVKIDGTAEPGSTVTLYDSNGTTVIGTGASDATTGAFGITTSTLSNGTHSITAKATDAAGNTGVASAAYSVTVTSTAPPAPTGLSLDTTTDSGATGDGITNFVQVKIDGAAAAGSTVTLYDTDGTTVLGTGTADATTGAFSITTSTLSNGTHNITAKATDGTGNTSAASAAYSVTVDTIAPAAPTGLSLDSTTDSGAKGDGITNVAQVKIDGTAEPGSTVMLYDTNGTTVIGTGTADATTGAFSVATSALVNGAHSITAKATDAAGNTGAASTAYSVTVDMIAPAAPAGLSLDSTTDSGTPADGITNFTQVKIDGTAEAGSTVTLYDSNGTTVLGSGTANATTGSFSITTSALANGTHSITAKATDAAGNTGAASAAYAVTVDTIAPAAPAGLSLDGTTDSGTPGDGITNFTQVKIDGTAEAGSTVTLYDSNGTTVLGSGTANATTGAFSITTSALANGTHSITAKATDAAGNIGAASVAYAVTVDTIAPAAPAGLSLDGTTDSGTPGDGITNFTQVKIDGTAEAGSTVTLYDTNGATVLGSGIANATTGAFSVATSALVNGAHSITAKATDAAGNTGAASTAYSVTVDMIAPAAPTGLSLDSTTDSGTLGDGITNFTQVKIDGTAEPGSRVTLYDTNGTTVLGSGTADATTGVFGITTSVLSSGTHSITAAATDAAGNTGPASIAYAVTETSATFSSEIDAQFSGPSVTSTYPPHNGLAVGPNNIVMVEGSRIEWTNLAGGSPTLQSTYNFFSSLSPTGGLYDQRCVYDPINQRYIVIMEYGASGGVSAIDIAVSKDANPNDGWYFASLNTSLTINNQLTVSDRPMLSVDGTNIYITATQGSAGTECWVIGDTAGPGGGIYNGGTLTVTANQLIPSSQGVFSVVAGNNGKTYYASSYSNGSQIVVALQTYDVATSTFGPISTIGLGNIDQGGSYTAQQLGTSLLLDAGDKRIQNLVYANGFLYGVTEEKPIGSSVPLLHWFKIDISNPNSPALVAQGDISGAPLGSNVATFNGSIAVDGAGDVIINFTASGPNMYPGDYYVFHAATDPSGSFSAPIQYQASTGFFNSGNGSSVQRWGLYSSAIADPANPHSFWVSNEYVANGWWQTSVAQVEVDVAEAPTLAISNAALTVSAGGSVPLGVQVTPIDADDVVSVTISGLTSYETITDNLDQSIFSGSSVTLSAAEVNSGLTLHSSYTGSDHPVNNLILAASNTTSGEAATSAAQTIVVTDPPAISSSQIDTEFSGISVTSTYPPHNGLAVGPNNIVMVEGSRIEWTNLTGGSPTLQSTYNFFSPLSPTGGLYDQRCAYDPINQRYIVIMEYGASGGVSAIDMAISKDANPNDGWYFASLNTSLTINNQLTVSDRPMLSVDGTNIYITATQGNAGTECWVIGDTAGPGGGIYNGGTLTVTANQLVPSSQGVFTVVAGNNGKTYYASSYSNGSQIVVALQVYDVATSTFGAISTIGLGKIDQGGSYTAQQLGTSLLLDAGDKRIQNLVYANGFLYGVTEEKPIGSSVPLLHWFKIDISNPSSPTLVAQGDISGTSLGSNVATFNGSIAVDGAGDVIINFTASGPNMYPSDYYVFQSATDPVGSFSAPIQYQASSGFFNSGNGSSVQRWGIYSTAIADPNNPNTFWISNEYVGNNWWQTSVAQIGVKSSSSTTVASIVTSGPGIIGGSGDLNAGKVVTLTVNFSSAVTVDTTAGLPTLALNDGGSATYSGGSGTSALTFNYTVASGQNTSDLIVSALNLNGATIRDGVGNAADLSGATNYNPAGILQIDTTAPVAPTGLSLDPTTDSGVVGDGITNFSQVKIDGTAEPGNTVTLYDTNGTTVLGTGTANATTGAFSITTSVLADGTHGISAKATDPAGNTSVASAAYQITVDTDPPPAPTGLSLDPSTDSGTQGDGITNFTQVKIDGTAEPGNTVTLYDTDGITVLGTGLANATTGAFSITTSTLASGTHNITAKAVDVAGDASALSAAYAVTINTNAPPAPTGLSLDATTDSGVAGDGITSFAQVKIDGTAQAGSSVTLYDTNGTTVLGTGTANATTGAFSITTSVLADGAHSVSARATDANGNTSVASTAYQVTIDTDAPPVPTGLALDASTDSGVVGDGITNFSQVKIDGTAEPGNTVTLYDTNGTTVLGTGTANATTGAFSITTSVLADGTHGISAKATDPAGNTSVASAAYQITVDTDPPPAPTGLSLDPSTDSGTQGDGITNFAQVKIDGTAEPGNTVTLYDTDGITVLGTGLANATTGAFSITTSTLANGTHNITAKAVDVAGDASALSAAYAVTITTTPSSSEIDTLFSGPSVTSTYPPYNGLAVGPNNIVMVEGSRIEWTNLSGGSPTLQSTYNFFSPLSPTGGLYDQRCAYDPINQRYIVIMEYGASGGVSAIDMAISKDANPNDGWYFASLNTSLTINNQLTVSDRPMLSVDGTNIYITATQGNAGTECWVIGDTAGPGGGIYNGGTLTVTANQLVPSSQGVFTVVAGNNGKTYYASSYSNGSQIVVALQVYDVATSTFGPISTIGLGKIDQGGSYTAQQLGTSLLLDAGDKRIQNLVYANGFLYGVTEEKPIGSSVPLLHWFKIDISNPSSPTLVAQGDISGTSLGSNVATFNGSIAVDGAGDVIINFTASGPNMYPSDYYVFQSATDPVGSFSAPIQYQASSGFFNSGNGSSVQRWGLYSTAIADPANSHSFWVSNEYVANNWWQTSVAQIEVKPLAEAPTLTISNTALTVAAGGSVPLGVHVTPVDADDAVSVTIGGLTSYETITDNLDQSIFSGSSVTLSAAEVNSGLTLHSSYTGSDHPVNNLTLAASNTTSGEAATSAAQTIVVTDPPVIASGPPQSISPANPSTAIPDFKSFGDAAPAGLAPSAYTTLAALLDQYMAARTWQDAPGAYQSTWTTLQPTWLGDKEFLTRPQS